MPKKGKKGKGKGKGKKGKKGEAKGPSKKMEKAQGILAMAAQTANVWEMRLEMAEYEKNEFRENARQWVAENAQLQSQMQQVEKDTIDVIKFLKHEDQQKEKMLDSMQQEVKELKKSYQEKTDALVAEYSGKINDLEENLAAKQREIDEMQSELKLVKEFRRKRGQMQRELDEIKESMYYAEQNHQFETQRMEKKFFEEKIRLQHEANEKIAELAERAHVEAIRNLDETTRSVFKENVRVSAALTYHLQAEKEAKEKNETLKTKNDELQGENDMRDALVRQKIIENKQLKEKTRQLEEKVNMLEKALSHMVNEFETEKQNLEKRLETEGEAAKKELAKVKRTLELKDKEGNKVKLLARNILEERGDLEKFFHSSLAHVRREILTTQAQYRKDAQSAYQRKLFDAYAGKGEYPKVRTFTKNETSTNSVFRDFEAAERLRKLQMDFARSQIGGQVDIGDLTWEQRELVLRHLFAQMNGVKAAKRLAITPSSRENSSAVESRMADANGNTFLTQDNGMLQSILGSKYPVIPDIGEIDSISMPSQAPQEESA